MKFVNMMIEFREHILIFAIKLLIEASCLDPV
jgi:hypothetical protein